MLCPESPHRIDAKLCECEDCGCVCGWCAYLPYNVNGICSARMRLTTFDFCVIESFVLEQGMRFGLLLRTARVQTQRRLRRLYYIGFPIVLASRVLAQFSSRFLSIIFQLFGIYQLTLAHP